MKETCSTIYSFRKKMSNETLEKLCDSIVDSLYSDLGRGQFFISTLQGKNRNIYLRLKKKEVEVLKKIMLLIKNDSL